jgi:hypothetical protein
VKRSSARKKVYHQYRVEQLKARPVVRRGEIARREAKSRGAWLDW